MKTTATPKKFETDESLKAVRAMNAGLVKSIEDSRAVKEAPPVAPILTQAEYGAVLKKRADENDQTGNRAIVG